MDVCSWRWKALWMRRASGVPDALADRECLLEERGGLGGVTIPQVALGESFQGASHSPDSSQNVT